MGEKVECQLCHSLAEEKSDVKSVKSCAIFASDFPCYVFVDVASNINVMVVK